MAQEHMTSNHKAMSSVLCTAKKEKKNKNKNKKQPTKTLA
jgi:hypothetical protein